MRKKISNIISTVSLALIMFLMPIFSSGLNSNQTKEITNQTKTRTIVANENLNFDSYYNKVKEQCVNVEFEYNEDYNQFNFTATQIIPNSIFEEIDNVSLTNNTESVSVTYNTNYDPETNLVTLYAYTNGERSDALVGVPFTAENGEIDVAFYADGEIVYLSELQDAGVIQNCGWLSNLFKKVVKVVAVVAVAAVTAVAVAAVSYVAAPVIATVVSSVVTGVSSGAAVLGSTAAVSAAISTGAAAIASTAATVATTAAVVAGTAYLASEVANVVESATGSLTINDTYTIGAEVDDALTKDVVKKIATTTTIASLREMTRTYHIAFVVSQKFTDAGTDYSVGELYISPLALTFDEAYAILIKSGMVNAISNLTSNADIIADVGKAVMSNDMTNLIEKLKSFKSKGYFSTKTQGIYADSVEAAATLAAITGAWIKDAEIGLIGAGGTGGYNHFHNSSRTIHIWYGSKI